MHCARYLPHLLSCPFTNHQSLTVPPRKSYHCVTDTSLHRWKGCLSNLSGLSDLKNIPGWVPFDVTRSQLANQSRSLNSSTLYFNNGSYLSNPPLASIKPPPYRQTAQLGEQKSRSGASVLYRLPCRTWDPLPFHLPPCVAEEGREGKIRDSRRILVSWHPNIAGRAQICFFFINEYPLLRETEVMLAICSHRGVFKICLNRQARSWICHCS